MANRKWVMFVAGACVGIGAVWMLTRHNDFASVLQAAEPKVSQPVFTVAEHRPSREVAGFRIWSYRSKASGQPASYSIVVHQFTDRYMSAEQAAAIVQFYKKYKDTQKSEKVAAASVSLGSDLTFDLGEKKWVLWGVSDPYRVAVLVAGLEVALKDLAAFKEIPFSVEP